MTAGFRSWTDTGYEQLTDSDFNFSLFTKGILTSAGNTWLSEGGNSGYVVLTISGYSTADVPMLALSSSSAVWGELVSSTGSSITYNVYRVGSSDVEWFLFCKKSPPVSAHGVGLRIFNSAGSLIYSSEYPIARPIGVYDQTGYTGIDITGRKLAIVPVKQRSYDFTSNTSGGLGTCTYNGTTPGYQVYTTSGFSRTAISAGVGSLGVNPRAMSVGPSPVYCSNTPVTQGNTRTSEGFRALVLDVTNY